MASNGSVEKIAGSTGSTQYRVSDQTFPNTNLPNTLVTTYLQMTHWSEFRPAYLNYFNAIKVMRMDTPDVAFYRFLYATVGHQCRWHNRLSQSDEELKALLVVPGTSVHVLYVHGAPAGYIELVQHREGPTGRFYSTEIADFGLRHNYTGQGLGKHLLSHGIAYAWNKGTQRLWVHTCNLDAAHVLDNYIERGFKVYRVEEEPMPEHHH